MTPTSAFFGSHLVYLLRLVVFVVTAQSALFLGCGASRTRPHGICVGTSVVRPNPGRHMHHSHNICCAGASWFWGVVARHGTNVLLCLLFLFENDGRSNTFCLPVLKPVNNTAKPRYFPSTCSHRHGPTTGSCRSTERTAGSSTQWRQPC